MRPITITTAARNKLIADSKFDGYNACLNPYVGCEFGCSYCYVRFFVKDEKPWGEFIRPREHITDKLVKEFKNWTGSKLVIGTMTDPYTPIERKHRLTRSALQKIVDNPSVFSKVGIYTRSQLIIRDLDLIEKLPDPHIHLTIPPLSRNIQLLTEKIPVKMERRLKLIDDVSGRGIKIHVNVAPCIPLYSEEFIDEFCYRMAKAKIHHFFVDPFQAYKESMDSLNGSLSNDEKWIKSSEIIMDNYKYKEWKKIQYILWKESWDKVRSMSPDTIPEMCDHMSKSRVDMRTGKEIGYN